MANTGRVRYQETDVNPNSPTYNTTRWGPWIDNEALCPPAARYTSIAVTGMVSKNDCPSGQTTQAIPFTVPAGTFFSYTSQADANQQAQDYFDANKQAYANANGVCGTRSVSITSVVMDGKNARLTLTRTTTTGSVDVSVYVEVTMADPSGSLSDSRTRTATIADGQSQVVVSASFSSYLESIDDYRIVSTSPSDYTF